ncbi:hypothetical protein ACLKA7_005447 [Drosophila subpalustris]
MPCQQLTDVEIDVAMAALYPRTNVLYEACPATINRVKPSCLPLHYRVFPLNSVCRNAAADFPLGPELHQVGFERQSASRSLQFSLSSTTFSASFRNLTIPPRNRISSASSTIPFRH